MEALIELARRRALVALALSARPVDDQRARAGPRPVVVRLEVGAVTTSGLPRPSVLRYMTRVPVAMIAPS